MAKKEKTSLEKSHSAWSNTKLTVLCIISSLAVTAVWVFLALKDTLFNKGLVNLFTIGIVISSLISLITLIMFNKFKR